MSTGKWKRPHPRKTGAQLWARRKPNEGDNMLQDFCSATSVEQKREVISKYNPLYFVLTTPQEVCDEQVFGA